MGLPNLAGVVLERHVKTLVQPVFACAAVAYLPHRFYQPPGMTLKQWTAEVGKIQHVYGVPLSDDEITTVGAYLAVTYGTTQESELLVPPPLVVVPVQPVLDATRLLTANSYLACHAPRQKNGGAAYHDVALHYHSNHHAQLQVEASIRNGGGGQWMQIPMPPFSELTQQELRTRAEFILKQ